MPNAAWLLDSEGMFSLMKGIAKTQDHTFRDSKMIKLKTGVILVLVSIVCGSAGFWWGHTSALQQSSKPLLSPAAGVSDNSVIATQNQFTLLQEILVAVKAMQEQVSTLNDRQDAFGEQINTLKEQQMVLFNQYEDLFANAQQYGGVQPPADETLEQPNAVAKPSLEAAQEAMQNLMEQQQAIRQSPQFQEKRRREKREAMEWTDSLDPDALPSDG